MVRIGIDTGGTFTDTAVFDGRRLRIHKLPTTSDDPSIAIASGMKKAFSGEEPITILAHGTTIGTNALLQNRLPPTAFITTRGFRDVIEIGRQKRLGLYDLDPRKPQVPVPRHLRLEVKERVRGDGAVETALVESEIAGVVEKLTGLLEPNGVQAVAVGFLHSYQSPAHEQAVEERLRERFGERLVVCRSSAVLPEFREYERFSTTILNAALTPILKPYLQKLAQRLQEEDHLEVQNLFITQSDGTLLLAEEMGTLPIRSVLSGPSSGVIGAKAVMARLGIANYITLDMGGTSTDISAVQDGEPLIRGELDIGSYVIKTPSLDIHTVGAGGGSIARVDAGGHLKVGPESAGAEPGPAAYGKGGERPTVTDANVFLGFLPTDSPLAGELALQREPAEQALRSLAETSGLSIEETAEGILAIEVSNMERAVRRLVAGRGIDLREQLLVVFGGAGPLHASPLARSLGVREIVVPTHPGLMCAIGLLVADMQRSFTTTRKLPAHDEGWRQGRRLLDELRRTAQEWVDKFNVTHSAVRVEASVDARYVGQNYELPVTVPEPAPDNGSSIVEAFAKRHEQLYRFRMARECEFVTWRVTASVELPTYSPSRSDEGATTGRRVGRAYWDGRWHELEVLDRSDLGPDGVVEGPAVVTQMDSTTLLLEGDRAQVDEFGNLRIRVG